MTPYIDSIKYINKQSKPNPAGTATLKGNPNSRNKVIINILRFQ